VFANPLDEAVVDRVLALLELGPGARVLDVGCGNAELLIRLVERYGVEGTGIDPNADFIAEGRRRAAARGVADRLRLHAVAVADHDGGADAYDAALCIGATHAYGDFDRTLAALRGRVRPGGHVLIGDGYWKRTPDPGYLELLGAAPDEMTTHAGNVARAEALGFVLQYAAVAGEADWDHYEGLYRRAVERHVAEHPDDPETPAYRERIRRWHAGYLAWGRDTLGFGLYLLRV